MTRILLLNPNTTVSVTNLMVRTGQAVAAPGTQLVPMTAERGFPYIATRAEAQVGSAVVLEMLAEAHHGVDAAIVAAFGDPGLFGARELLDIPVIGVSEAAMLTACMLGQRFALVTFSAGLRPWFRDCVAMHGLEGRCAGIVSLNAHAGALDTLQDDQGAALVDLANRAVHEHEADVLIFAGAPLAGLACRVRDRIPVPVVDPIAAAVRHAETLVALKPRKAAAGAFARSSGKTSIGLSQRLAGLMGPPGDPAV